MKGPESREIERIKQAILAMDPEAFIYKPLAGAIGQSGMPDLYVCTQGNQWWLEVKIYPRKPTKNQEACMRRMHLAGCNIAVIRCQQEGVINEMQITVLRTGGEYCFYEHRGKGKKWNMTWLYREGIPNVIEHSY